MLENFLTLPFYDTNVRGRDTLYISISEANASQSHLILLPFQHCTAKDTPHCVRLGEELGVQSVWLDAQLSAKVSANPVYELLVGVCWDMVLHKLADVIMKPAQGLRITQ